MKKTISHNCSVCKSNNFIKLFSVGDFDNIGLDFDLLKCKICGMVQIYPLPDKKLLNTYYQQTYYGAGRLKFISAVEKAVVLANKYRANKIVKYITKVPSHKKTISKILDIGCGRGLLLNAFKKKGFDCFGVEREEFTSTHEDKLTIFKKDLKDIGFKTVSMDVIVLWHVFEHLIDPTKTLEELTRILKPGGLLVLSVPNFNSFQSFYFKNHWFHLDLPRHHYHFSLKNLNMLLNKNNYTIIYKSTYSVEQNIFGFIQSFFNKFIFFLPNNSFYFLLKQDKKKLSCYIKLCLWILLSLLIIPLAVTEFFASGILNRGAVLTIIAKKYI